MATPQQYAAATTAVLKIIQAEIEKEVPAMFRGRIPAAAINQFAAEAAKAAVDAAEQTES